MKNPPWGRLANEALDAGLGPEDALWAVLVVGTRLQRGLLNRIPKRDFGGDLTPRELDVLRAVARVTPVEAALELGVTEGTVLEHMKKVRAKLCVTKTVDAVNVGRELGLVDPVKAAA